ncbi:hypothetical protein [Streptomyces sp. NPDC003327]
MADERYQWLDQEAAERLLRGEPVDAVDDRTRSRARRLAEALDTARTPALAADPTAELPGEAAALAAFRKVTAERAALAAETAALTAAAADAGTPDAPAGARADLGRIRIAPLAAPARRWGRSVRYGLAAAVAAVTVGGVAVAAGTGVLPIGGPEPAASVTAVESPEPVITDSPGIRKDPDTPPAHPDPDGRPSGTPGTPTAGTPAPPSGGTATDPSGTPGTDAGDPASTGGTDDGKDKSDGTGGPGTTLTPDKARARCLDYRAGRLDDAGRRQLTDSLPAGETLRRYCDRILSSETGAPGGSTGPGDSEGGDSKGGGSKDDDAKEDDPGRGDDRHPGGRDGSGGTTGRDSEDAGNGTDANRR